MKVFISADGKEIDYTSDNGYRGKLYGESSMMIWDPCGKEVMHTFFRTPNTLEELQEVVDTMPEFMKTLNEMLEKW